MPPHRRSSGARRDPEPGSPGGHLAFIPISCFRSGLAAEEPDQMPRRPRRPEPPLPAGLIPPDLVRRHDLWRRLYLDPLTGLTPRHPWAPMSDAEWAALAPHLAAHGCGLAPPG